VNFAHLADEVVRQELSAHVVFVGVAVGRGGPEGELQEGLQPSRHDVVDVLGQLSLAHVHELDDEVALVVQEVTFHRPEAQQCSQSPDTALRNHRRNSQSALLTAAGPSGHSPSSAGPEVSD